MLLNLRSLQGAREHIDKRYEPALFESFDRDVCRIVAPVVLSFDVSREAPGRYRVTGHVTSEAELNCSRCLEPFTTPVHAEFDLDYVPTLQNSGEGEREVEEDDLATAYYSDDQIDLGHLIAEQIQLSIPMKPLCRADCKGLCPHCGTNLNTGTCECSGTWEDPRFAALKQLKK